MTDVPWPTIITSIIVASVSIAATIAYNRWAEGRRLRVECFRQLMRHHADSREFWLAFNEVPVVFASSPAVVRAHQAALDRIKDTRNTTPRELIDLLWAISANLGMERGVSEEQLVSRFNSPP
jgi:hypothetical protein